MLRAISKSRFTKIFSVLLALNILAEIIAPNMAFALTSGPSQPEVQSFEPIGTSEMVDLFSGDFTYNIPLMDVDGYPVNISYNSGIGMDQEASWVGLGWNINPGAITRNMRGIPDDFKGDIVTKTLNMKPNRTYGVTVGLANELFGNKTGTLNVSYSLGVKYNNYNGVGIDQSMNAAFASGEGGKGPWNADLGITSGSDGLSINPSGGYGKKIKDKENKDASMSGKVGLSINSRTGLSMRLKVTASGGPGIVGGRLKSKPRKEVKVDIRGSNGGANISFSTPTYTPQVSNSMINSSVTVSVKTGGTFIGFDGTVDLAGYYSEQRVAEASKNAYAYGYLNSGEDSVDAYALHDFNREKDGTFTRNSTNLPVTNYTYDIYSVAGQGIGGMYRPFRSDLGYVYDAETETKSMSGSLGVEIAGGNAFHGGVDVGVTDVNTVATRWTSGNAAASKLRFRKTVSGKPLYEPYYFKEAGEKTVDSDPALFTSIGSTEPVKVKLKNMGGLVVKSEDKLETRSGGSLTIPTNNFRSARQKRNQAITLMNASEATEFALEGDITDYPSNTFTNVTPSTIARYATGSGAVRKSHHISEISTLRTDGSRYVFGIPAYNNFQKEVTFNASGRSKNCSTGLITYGSGDNSTSNARGIDNYYSQTATPAYAHSYLLTAVLSPDYIDHDGTEGPSEGDYGNYTKFNYTRAHSQYLWRAPLGTNSANYNEGLKSDPDDDQGNYIYGSKEVWYLHSIETKNYIAEFTLGDRDDGYGVTGENGTVGGNPLKKLVKISLYTRKDRQIYGSNAVPIKEVHFEYDYSLCKGVPNNLNAVPSDPSTGGKLTLKKIYFTYGASLKAKLSPYEFVYADPDHNGISDNTYNPDYNLKGYDSWGNYKPNNGTSTCSVNSPITTSEYPYVDQDTATANQYAQAWALTSIALPSGGKISIDLESDDYAYVQDRQAMQMFRITGIGNDVSTDDPDATSQDMLMPSTTTINEYLYFELQTPIDINEYNTAEKQRTFLANNYFNGISNIYYRFLVDITKFGDWEYVSGYLDRTNDLYQGDDNNDGVVEDFGIVTNAAYTSGGNYLYGWIRIDDECTGDRNDVNQNCLNMAHPISRTAWQFGRLYRPTLIWDQPNVNDPGIEQVLTALANSNYAANLLDLFNGPNKTIRDKGYGQRVKIGKCWVRLLSPEKKKLGGGARVKQVSISDEWNAMSGLTTYSYGQEYDYTTTEGGVEISSGVASYEPAAGGDENPFRQPVYFTIEKRMVPDDESYLEEPFGESFFPSPSVGYSKVRVRNLQYANVKRHATGHVIHEFYTAKDFPTITKQTGLDARRKKISPLITMFGIAMRDYMTASQGYTIELNDMHGKPKAQWVYAEGQQAAISGVEYFYKTSSSNRQQLDNTVYTINKSGTVTTNTVGLDYDMIADMRENRTSVISASLNGNLAGFLAAVLPVAVPTILPSLSKEETRFRSAVVTKVINRYGILERTVAHDAGHTVSTENLAYDAETGELLVTKTKNDFEDAIYSFTYPAHWSYDRMGQAYKNIGAQFSSVSLTSGVATVTNGNQVFVKGDEVSLNGTTRAWVCDVTNGVGTGGTNATITLMNSAGAAPSNGTYAVKIIRSGRRNQQTTPIGNVTTKTNPLVDTNSDQVYDAISFTDVLNASASEFSENWQMKLGYTDTTGCSCERNSLSNALLAFIDQLAEDSVLTSSSENVYNNPNYYHGYSSTLHTPLGIGTSTASWSASMNDNVLTGSITCGCTPGCAGAVTLYLPEEYDWEDVRAFSNMNLTDEPTSSCGNIYTFTVTASLTINGSSQDITIYGSTSSCWPVANCVSITPAVSQCGKLAGDVINPYFEGVRGNWRPLRSHAYLSDRLQTSGTNNNLDIRKDGTYITYDQSTNAEIAFQPFWLPGSGADWSKDDDYWTWTSEVTKYNSAGTEVENKDALNRYSAAVYGYNNTLPVAVAANAKYNEIAFDGFEDYNMLDLLSCERQHFNFFQNGTIRSTIAHSGRYSLRLMNGQSITATRPLTSTACTTSADNCSYTLKQCDDLGTFSPETYNGAKRYVLSAWVRETVPTPPVFTYSNADITIKVGGATVSPVSTTTSDIIEGWQRVEIIFDIASAATGDIEIILSNSGATNAYFDDIRIHPFNSNMKTFVYHPHNLRYVATLDENNYATFYEYDEEGALVRVKKETERGIVTIQENRNSKSK